MTWDEISVGDTASLEKTVSESDVYGFAGITGDFNPAHVNERYAAKTEFGRRIAHGMLTGGLLASVFGTKLPGPGSIYVSQELVFNAPVFFGDTILVRVIAEEKLPKRRILFGCEATNQEGVTIATGKAVLMPPKSEYNDALIK